MKRLKALKARLIERTKKLKVPETIFVGSIATIGVGVAFVYWPAGLIVTGILAALLTYLYVRHDL